MERHIKWGYLLIASIIVALFYSFAPQGDYLGIAQFGYIIFIGLPTMAIVLYFFSKFVFSLFTTPNKNIHEERQGEIVKNERMKMVLLGLFGVGLWALIFSYFY